MRAEQAEVIALQALGWIVGQEDLRDVFLGATGADSGELAARAQETEFQAAVLGFLVMDDDWIMRFCDARGLAYTAPQEALACLPGQGLPHWT